MTRVQVMALEAKRKALRNVEAEANNPEHSTEDQHYYRAWWHRLATQLEDSGVYQRPSTMLEPRCQSLQEEYCEALRYHGLAEQADAWHEAMDNHDEQAMRELEALL